MESLVESIIISLTFISIIFFDKIMLHRHYSCPEYCAVEHEHAEDEYKDWRLKGGI